MKERCKQINFEINQIDAFNIRPAIIKSYFVCFV